MFGFEVFDFDTVAFLIKTYAVILSVVGVVASTRKLRHLWRTRHLRQIWGIKDGDAVTIVCSELEDPAKLQYYEPREFIYSRKYGDVDAYFEVVITLLRLYPAIRLRIMSAGEVENTRMDLSAHLILIGGPDYNLLASRVLEWGSTQFVYRSPYVACRSTQYPDEIVVCDVVSGKEYCHQVATRDFGYFERIVNRNNLDSHVILVGGCHTIGVTGAVKAFSMAESEQGEISLGVVRNAALVAKKIGKSKRFSVLVSVEQIGQTIITPIVEDGDVTIRSDR